MRNPLYKRIPKEFIHDIVKYIVMFLFLALPIGLCSGYMIGNDSMIKSYNEGIEKYVLEDGHLTTNYELADEDIKTIEEDNNLTIYKLFYKNEVTTSSHTIRIYNLENRLNINKWCIHQGNIPTNKNEIALDRLYMENNNINLGDYYEIGNIKYKIVSSISLMDYSTLFKNNTDSMFDAKKFSISLVTNDQFNEISNDNLVYNYAYLYPNRLNEKEANDKTNDLIKYLYSYLYAHNNSLVELLPKEANQAINFSIDDIEGDLTMMLIFGLLIVFGLAFVFALSIKSQIEKEAKSIGTLKALGFKNTELLIHYLILPLITTILSAIFGNILAYTVLKDYLVGLYYHSYSLPTYVTYYNANALIFTTIIPVAMVLLINVLIILKTLFVPSLNLLKNQLVKSKHKKVIHLSSKIRFIPRYQLRVIFQNKGTYLALFFGTLLASIILLFGLMMSPLLDHYKKQIIDNQIAPYQTILKYDIDLDEGEKFYFTTLNYENDEIMIYGLNNYADNSKYLSKLNIKDLNKVIICKDLKSKYGLSKNDVIKLEDKYLDKQYEFKIEDYYETSGSLIIFMDISLFEENFSEYNTAYFSNNELNINKEYIYKTITLDDLVNISNQLTDSMGKVFVLFTIISIILFTLLIFLLAKIVIEKNQNQISMLKIIGYNTIDINKIYNVATGIVTLISIIISTFISQLFIKIAWDFVLRYKMKGWLDFYIAPYLYIVIFGIGVISFAIVYLFESLKISKINLADALKQDTM